MHKITAIPFYALLSTKDYLYPLMECLIFFRSIVCFMIGHIAQTIPASYKVVMMIFFVSVIPIAQEPFTQNLIKYHTQIHLHNTLLHRVLIPFHHLIVIIVHFISRP